MRPRPTKPGSLHAGAEPCRVAVAGDTVISEQGMVALVARDKRYLMCGAAHTSREANEIIRQHRPDVLLIEPFLENALAIGFCSARADLRELRPADAVLVRRRP